MHVYKMDICLKNSYPLLKVVRCGSAMTLVVTLILALWSLWSLPFDILL